LANPSLPKYQNEAYINALLRQAAGTPERELNRILDKAASVAGFKGLTPQETAALLTAESTAHKSRLLSIAKSIKAHIYGDRIILFAPLYISDYCVNDCAYCGFRQAHDYPRRVLTQEEVKREAEILTRMGHKRIALEAGEDPVHCPPGYILDTIQTLYENGIRRVNVNVAAMDTEDYRRLKDAGIGTYILFQETYHRPTYQTVHPKGPKSDYAWHTEAFDRAMQAGIDDVGGGVLFGLYNHRYEALALMLHNQYLEETYGVGFHTVSLPRICKAVGASHPQWPHAVADGDFLYLTAVLRVAVPYTGMIISTRETPAMRKALIECGVSQLSGGSAVEVGGYAKGEHRTQFDVADKRSPHDILLWLMDEDLVPSYCTACYRSGRTGDRFMSLAKSGGIKHVCLPNALITLAEYAADYGNAALKEKAAGLITRKLALIEDETLTAYVKDCIARINTGERDFFI
jgi:2-iminoacetate synthase